jgi:hypothetical protein
MSASLGHIAASGTTKLLRFHDGEPARLRYGLLGSGRGQVTCLVVDTKNDDVVSGLMAASK